MKFTDLTKTQQETLVREGVNGLASTATLLNAARHLRKGRVGHALFFVALWHGFNSNAEATRNASRHKEIVAHHECAHRLAGVSPAATVRPTPFLHGMN